MENHEQKAVIDRAETIAQVKKIMAESKTVSGPVMVSGHFLDQLEKVSRFKRQQRMKKTRAKHR